MGLRQTKKERTRAALARAAAEIARYGTSEMQNIATISERADVSPRTFHNYFSSRDEALEEFCAMVVRELLDTINDTTATEIFEAVEEATLAGLRRGDELMSFYSLNVLAQQADFNGITTCAPKNQLQRDIIDVFHRSFPHKNLFDLCAELAAAAGVAQYAVQLYFNHNGTEDIIHRAFDQFRTPTTAEQHIPPEALGMTDEEFHTFWK